MSKKKPFISLTIKMSVSVLLGIALAICMYACCMWIEQAVTNHKYQSEEAIEMNLNAAYDSLETYIQQYNVEATDTKALSKWVKSQEYIYFFVYDNYTNIFEAGWWITPNNAEAPDGNLTDAGSALYDNVYTDRERRIDEANFTEDAYNRIITFADGKYYVYIDVYKEAEWQQVMNIVAVVLSFLTLLATILIYNGKLLQRIAILSESIQKVSDGDLNHQVFPLRNDELGALAVSVDNMRTSIIQKHENEKAAWTANQQLITEMSHDIRTPLTSMIGYLDIIEGKKYNNQEELAKYVSSCRDKAFQLKDLSDKLFQYFLVYGSQAEKELEKFDASILFQQLLMEHSAEIMSAGYQVDFAFAVPEVDVMVDISGVRRLFNNLFSNLMKYADEREVVSIDARVESEQIVVKISNTIAEIAKKVESNKIGLKTCEKICQSFNGAFVYQEEAQTFTVWVYLPVAETEPRILDETDLDIMKEQS